MPCLYILAGANGSGKTTWYYTAIKQGFIDPTLIFINVDIIVRNELVGGYTEENFAKAAFIARERINECINGACDFMIESNLATQADYNWIEIIQKKGYQLILYFLGTDDKQINYNRVLNRISEGGHSVPESIIKHRYEVGLSYLKSKILLFDNVFLIDNSFELPRKLAEIKDKKLIFIESNAPLWVTETLFIIKKMSIKK